MQSSQASVAPVSGGDTEPAVATTLPSRPWIVSPWWDLSYVVVTPLAIVPIVLILSRHWFTPEQISLAAISFASLGHHLPGFMRAYGDRELFRRFPWRFLLVPILVFAVALLFSPPQWLAGRLDLPWRHLHGLELILLFWGTWHGLMQTFGFMRIYDVRRGQNNPHTARLDHWLCFMMFTAGVVFSDVRMFGVSNAMWQTGLPIFSPPWLEAIRWIVGSVGVVVLLLYAMDLFRIRQRGESIGWIKLLLAGTTGWFYWYTGRLSTNLLIGLAMFEIYHAVQYNAIVWIYNCKLLKRVGERFGLLGFLFRDRWTMLGVYLAAIGAYSSIRLLAGGANGPVYFAAGGDAYQWLMALFVTSSTLHFYFDGFIWKVSEQSTQQNLVENAGEEMNTTARDEHVVSRRKHALKWVVLLVFAAGLLLAERNVLFQSEEREIKRVDALIALTPSAPESRALASHRALARGDIESAVDEARRALALRPRSHAANADLALALIESAPSADSESSVEARQLLREAVKLAPHDWRYRVDLGLAYEEFGDLKRAETEFRQAVRLQPQLQQTQLHLVEYYLRQGQADRGLFQAAALVEQYPESWRSQLALGVALNADGRYQEAIEPLQRAIQVSDDALPRYQLGLARLQLGDPRNAIKPLLEAVRSDPKHTGALLQLGNAFYALQKWQPAIDAYGKCRQLQPDRSEVYVNLGAALAQADRTTEAEKTYRQGLKQRPKSSDLNYNLGILLWQSGQTEKGRAHIRLAQELGMKLSPEVQKALAND